MTDPIRIDADIENADWTKQSWDFPPYRSPEFMELVPDLDAFRKTPAYAIAVERGFILDDEWVGDWVEPAVVLPTDPKPQTRDRRRVHLHIHKGKP